MCPDCYNAHEMLKASFEGHKVTPVKEFKSEDYEALLKREPFCSQQFHEKEITRFFCFSCRASVRHICVATDHRNHEIVFIDKAAEEEKHNIMSDAEMIEKKMSELNEVIQQFEETISRLERNVETVKRGVTQAGEQMIADIREREREAIASLETTRVSRLEIINSAMQDAQSLVKQMKQAVEFANNLAQRSSSLDIMWNKETLEQRFEELRAVQVHEQNDQTLQVGVEAEFTLCPKASEGELSNQADLKDQGEFLIEPAKDVTNVMVSEKEDGNLQLKFTPTVPGPYSVEVKINGDKRPTCPFTMQVKERELVVVGELDLEFFQGDAPEALYGIAVNTEGKIIVTDYTGHCAYVLDQDGNCLRKIGSQGSNSGQFKYPTGVSFLNDNEILLQIS